MPQLQKSKSLIIQAVAPYQTNPGPIIPPAPYNYKGLTYEDEAGARLTGNEKEGYKSSSPYTPSENNEYAEKGDIYLGTAGGMRYQLSLASFEQLPLPEHQPEFEHLQSHSSPSTQGVLYHYDKNITTSEIDQPRPETPSHASQYVSEDKDEIWWLSPHPSEIQQHKNFLMHRRQMMDTLPEREYKDFVVPPPRGWRSALDAHERTVAQQDYESALMFLILGQGRELAMIGRHTEHPGELVMMNEPRGSLSTGTEMVCFGDLNNLTSWIVSHQRIEKGNFYKSVWVNHVLKKRVKVWVLKDHFYPVPTTNWLRYVAKKLLKANTHPSKSTSHLSNF